MWFLFIVRWHKWLGQAVLLFWKGRLFNKWSRKSGSKMQLKIRDNATSYEPEYTGPVGVIARGPDRIHSFSCSRKGEAIFSPALAVLP